MQKLLSNVEGEQQAKIDTDRMGALRALSVSKFYSAEIRKPLIEELRRSLKKINVKISSQAFIDGLIGIGHGGDLDKTSITVASKMIEVF